MMHVFAESGKDTPKDATYQWELICGGVAWEKPSDNLRQP
jgi:hypothetical protein